MSARTPGLLQLKNLTTYGTNNEKGSGLGLNLCKELVELNHGGIRFESESGKGSTFYVILPTENPDTMITTPKE